jgi:hypothetical protein
LEEYRQAGVLTDKFRHEQDACGGLPSSHFANDHKPGQPTLVSLASKKLDELTQSSLIWNDFGQFCSRVRASSTLPAHHHPPPRFEPTGWQFGFPIIPDLRSQVAGEFQRHLPRRTPVGRTLCCGEEGAKDRDREGHCRCPAGVKAAY